MPNVLSFLRLAMVPVFLVLIVRGDDGLALLVLVISSVTDFLDGVIARGFNQITRLGQLLDPAADRLYIFAALIGLAWRELVPWWLVVIVVVVFLQAGLVQPVPTPPLTARRHVGSSYRRHEEKVPSLSSSLLANTA